MGILKPGAGLAAALAAAAVAFAPESPLNEGAGAQATAQASLFRVFHAGQDTGCEVSVGAEPSPARVPLILGGACAAAAAFEKIRYWTDRDDGTIELSDESGAVEMRLAAGDGAAFEAYGPGAPLIMLVDTGR